MYRLGENERSHRKLYLWLIGFVIVVTLAGYLALKFLKPLTSIGAPPPVVTTHVSYDTTKLVTFDTPYFRIQLPDDWKATSHPDDIPKPLYTWQGSLRDNANRWINVYVDQNVATLAVNRELAVQANGARLNVLSDVSDNCTTFTGNATQNHGSTPAKWQGIGFNCDSGNYERDVVGIVSPDGLNNVNLTGNQGTHHYFITYTDNSVSPDYSIFINAVKSISAK